MVKVDIGEAKKKIASSMSTLYSLVGELINYRTDISYSEIKQMLNDEVVGSGLDFLVHNVVNMIGEYAHPDENINEFVKANFENMTPSFEIVLERLVKDLRVYGIAVAEKVWEEKNGMLYVKEIVPLPIETISLVYEDGELVSIKQTQPKLVEIPRWKCIVMRQGNTPYGESSLRRIYRVWKMKKAAFGFWAVALERYTMPIVWGQSTDGNILEELKDVLANLWTEPVITTTDNVKIDLIESKTKVADLYEKTIEYANIMIYRGLLLPQMLLSNKDVGSYALGKVHYDLFMTNVKRIARFVAEKIIDELIVDILDFNFQNVDDYGQFLETEIPSSDERTKMAQVIEALIQTGVLNPVDDNDWIRDLFKFPKQEEISQSEEEKQEEEEIWSVLQRSKASLIEQKKE